MEKYTDKRVADYMAAVEKRINDDYGTIPAEWSAQLKQLSDIYSCYLKASDTQAGKYVTTTINDGKTECKTLELTVMLDCISAMKKIIAEFGLSPRAKSMIKNQTVESDDFAEKFLND
jgi:phage terminase small subunit